VPRFFSLSRVAPELLEIAKRIASAEHRVSTLAARIERLKQGGSDATQALELLRATRHELNRLYGAQVSMRRQGWISKSVARLRPDVRALALSARSPR
jgi:hypothetical protein